MPGIFFPSSKPRFVNSKEIIAKLKEVALNVAGANGNVAAVYLFGSHTQGNAGLHSDADILVVLKKDSRAWMERQGEYILAFADAPVPVDVLVYTKEELDAALRKGNSFLSAAITGIKLV
ncbi:MAG: nucleotidyltransferase domain-containing protein [Candidatus Omnitrophota bacterium]